MTVLTPRLVYIRFVGTHQEYSKLTAEQIKNVEKEKYPIKVPSLSETLTARMSDMHYTQKELAELLEMSAPRLCDILKGKKNPTYEQARIISIKLHIDPAIVLSV